jgi:hypothetical protein
MDIDHRGQSDTMKFREARCRSVPRSRRRGAVWVCTAVVALSWACASGERKQIEPEYDQQTGKLKLLKYDANKDGKVDTTSFMDGARVLRIEIDQDQDGKVERWEYYGPGQKLEKVGFSRLNDGKEDAWSFAAADGSISRIEIATQRDGKISRTESYEKDAPVRAEEDTNGDGKIDKWETFDAGRLASVAFDSTHRGAPDRRLVYAADGSVRIEVDPDGDGLFKREALK